MGICLYLRRILLRILVRHIGSPMVTEDSTSVSSGTERPSRAIHVIHRVLCQKRLESKIITFFNNVPIYGSKNRTNFQTLFYLKEIKAIIFTSKSSDNLLNLPENNKDSQIIPE